MNRVGQAVGAVVAPLFAAGSAIRRARVFHPVGVVHQGQVRAEHPLAAALAGNAILRFSGAIWRRDRGPDVLGLTIRFRGPRPLAVEADAQDQDLLLATFRTLPGLPLAVLTTDPHDFLGNVYSGGGWFEVKGLGRARPEVRPATRSPGAPRQDRADRLAQAVAEGTARLHLHAVEPDGTAVPLAVIEVGPRIELDDQALRFDPFRDGAGLSPLGLVQGMRAAVYPSSQAARPR